jgi:hypothetical protein
MNWDAIAAVGQAVSALALVIVMIQLRQTREEMQRSVGRMRLEGVRDTGLAFATHPELASALAQANEAAHGGMLRPPFVEYLLSLGLTAQEARQLYGFHQAEWTNTELAIEALPRMTLGVREGTARWIRSRFSNSFPLYAKYYELSKAELNPDTVRYIDNLLAQPG